MYTLFVVVFLLMSNTLIFALAFRKSKSLQKSETKKKLKISKNPHKITKTAPNLSTTGFSDKDVFQKIRRNLPKWTNLQYIETPKIKKTKSRIYYSISECGLKLNLISLGLMEVRGNGDSKNQRGIYQRRAGRRLHF